MEKLLHDPCQASVAPSFAPASRAASFMEFRSQPFIAEYIILRFSIVAYSDYIIL